MNKAEWERKSDWWMEHVAIPAFFTAATVWSMLVIFVFVAWLLTGGFYD